VAIDRDKFATAVGVNGSSDRTAEIARARRVCLRNGTTGLWAWLPGCDRPGNGRHSELRAYIFFAGDGASDPRDVRTLVDAYEQGYAFVLGARTRDLPTGARCISHVIANFAVAPARSPGGRWFKDWRRSAD
jgi:hypothetical protein